MQNNTPISGSFAIPAPDSEFLIETETSGLEDIVDWDDLEDALLEGIFPSRKEVRLYVQKQFDTANEKREEPVVLTKHMMQNVIDGLCNIPLDTPRTIENMHQWRALEVGAAYEALPDRGVLSPANVREIRRRSSQGETYTELGEAFGVHRTSIANIVNGSAWKDVA